MIQSFALQKVDFLSKTILKLFEALGALVRFQPVDSQKYLQRAVAIAFNSLTRASTIPSSTAPRPGLSQAKLPVAGGIVIRGPTESKATKEQKDKSKRLQSSNTSLGTTSNEEQTDTGVVCSLSPSASISSITSLSSNQSSKEEEEEETKIGTPKKYERIARSNSTSEGEPTTNTKNIASDSTDDDDDDDDDDNTDDTDIESNEIVKKKSPQKVADCEKEHVPRSSSLGQQKSPTHFDSKNPRYSKSFSTLNFTDLDNENKGTFKKISCDFSGDRLRGGSPRHLLQYCEEPQTSPLESDKYMYSIIQSFKNAPTSSGQQGFVPKVSRNSFVLSQATDVYFNNPNFYFFYLQLLENEVKGITKQHLTLRNKDDIDLSNPIEVHYLRSFLKSNFTDENLDFSCDVLHFKTLTTEEERKVYARYIYEMYISSNSPSQVNVNGKIRFNIQNAFVNNSPIRDTLFDLAFQEIFNTICSNSLIEQFKHSETYKRCIAHQKGMSDFTYPWQETPLPKRQETKEIDLKKKKSKPTQRMSGYPLSVTSDLSTNTGEYEPPFAKLLSTPEFLADFKSFLVNFKEPLSYLQTYGNATAKPQQDLRQSGSLFKSTQKTESTTDDEHLVSMFTTSIYSQYIKTGTWKKVVIPPNVEEQPKETKIQIKSKRWINEDALLNIGRRRATTFCDNSNRDWWTIGSLGGTSDDQDSTTINNKPKGLGVVPELTTTGKQKKGLFGFFKKSSPEKYNDKVKEKEKKRKLHGKGKDKDKDKDPHKKGSSFDEQDFISDILYHYDISGPTLTTTTTTGPGDSDGKQKDIKADSEDPPKPESTKVATNTNSLVEQVNKNVHGSNEKKQSDETESEEHTRYSEKVSHQPFTTSKLKQETNEESEEFTASKQSSDESDDQSNAELLESRASSQIKSQRASDANSTETLSSFATNVPETHEKSDSNKSCGASTNSTHESNPMLPFSFLPSDKSEDRLSKDIAAPSFTLDTDDRDERPVSIFSFVADITPTLGVPEPTTAEEAFRTSFTQKFNELAQILQSNLPSDGKRFKSAQQKVYKIKSVLDSYDQTKGKKVKQKHSKSEDKALDVQEIGRQLSAFFDAMIAKPENKEIASLTKALGKIMKE